jgi:hypothetical protein
MLRLAWRAASRPPVASPPPAAACGQRAIAVDLVDLVIVPLRGNAVGSAIAVDFGHGFGFHREVGLRIGIDHGIAIVVTPASLPSSDGRPAALSNGVQIRALEAGGLSA